MALEHVQLNAGAGGDKTAHDTITTFEGAANAGGEKAQIVKIGHGPDGTVTLTKDSTPLPVGPGVLAAQSTNAGTSTVNTAAYDVSRAGAVSFYFKNTTPASAFGAGGIAVFEQSDDGTSWAPLMVVRANTNEVAHTHVLGANVANGEIAFDAGLEGVNWVRVRLTAAVTTNGATIIVQPGSFAMNPFQVVTMGGMKPTYRASTVLALVTVVTANVPWLIIQGSATKRVKVQRIGFSGPTLTAVAYLHVNCAKYSTAVSGGTATALVKVPLDSNYPAATANLVQVYTAAPTSGTKVGDIGAIRFLAQATTAAAAGNFPHEYVFDFTAMNDRDAGTLRGIAEGIGLYWPVAPASAVTMAAWVEWTEEYS